MVGASCRQAGKGNVKAEAKRTGVQADLNAQLAVTPTMPGGGMHDCFKTLLN